MTTLAFVDCETTGLDSDYHEPWEIAVITADWHPDRGVVVTEEALAHVQPDLAKADPTGLRVGRYYERTKNISWAEPASVAFDLAHTLDGRHFIGAVPDFDARFLNRFIRRWGLVPTWHYHLIDVENLAAGKLGIAPPWDSDDLSRAVGVEPDEIDRHTALGDARWALAIFQAVMLGAAVS